MNIFRFLNVGQGLFYSGRIDCSYDLDDFYYYHYDLRRKIHYTFLRESALRFVYDCGSSSPNKEEYIFDAISRDFFHGEIVDIVFLSHLHDDHINGFERLNEYVNVRNVILPYMYNEPVILFTYLAINLNSDLTIDDNELLNKFDFYSRLYSQGLDRQSELQETKWEFSGGNNEIYEYHSKSISCKGWEFFLVNKRGKVETIKKIVEEIVTIVGGSTIDDISEYIRKDKSSLINIKNIYQKYFGKDMNLSSTVVLHNPIGDLSNVTVLTGDAEFDDEMIKICNNYLKGNNINYLQIPHHGSYKNWNKMKSLKDNAINLFVSFGLGNKYKHPSSNTIKEIHLSGRPLYCSTQSMMFLFPWNEYII